MKKYLGIFALSLLGAILVPLALAAITDGRPVVSWTHPTLNTDGTAIPAGAITATVIDYGTTAGGPYPNSVSVPYPAVTVTIPVPSPGTYFFTAKTRTTYGDSNATPEVSVGVTFQPPRPPSGLTVR